MCLRAKNLQGLPRSEQVSPHEILLFLRPEGQQSASARADRIADGLRFDAPNQLASSNWQRSETKLEEARASPV